MTDTLASNPYERIFTVQKALFRTGATRAREWRLDPLARMKRMVRENEAELQDAVKSDFKTASQEHVFETRAAIGEVAFQRGQLNDWMKPIEAPVPNSLGATGHRGVIYRDPYGVALIIGPFNGPLTLLLRPAIAALAVANTCILTMSDALKHTSEVLLQRIPRYFEEQAVAVVAGGREANTSLLQLPFDFIFFTGSTKVGKIVAKAAAEHLTPVLLELGGQNRAIVDGTGNIADAARKIVWGAMAWGQWCTSLGYAYVHESVADQFVAEANPSWRCSDRTPRTIRTIPASSARGRRNVSTRSSISPKSWPAVMPIPKLAMSRQPSSIPSPGNMRSWRMRSSAPSSRSSRARTSTTLWRRLAASLPLWRPLSSARGRTTSIGSSVAFHMEAAR
jgi:acyl-CoA reductase-like NAD-dependent aldehyde dehydrogenase